jgi:hypothetical protein
MIYKTPDCEDQLKNSAPKLQEVVGYFESLSLAAGIEPVITRVWDAVCGDSGVHEAHRAVDFRDETIPYANESKNLYTQEQVDSIVKAINEKYPRTDGKPVCLHHSFQGAPHHFHVQIPADWA